MRTLLILFGLAASLVACQSSTTPTDEPAPEAPSLETGVHLQAEFTAPDDIEDRIHDSMRYLIYLPDGYDQAQDWPMIVYLHGSGDDDYDSAYVMGHGLPAVLLAGEQPADFPFVVISPQAFPGGTWWTEDALPILDALIEDVIETYQVDPDRVYLTGVSMGGYGSWHLATYAPERFAAMASVSGSGYRSVYLPEEEILCRMGDIPVWAIHGDGDVISQPEASRISTWALTACEGDVTWTLYEGEGHLSTSERAYRDPALYEWMLSHRRP